MRRVYWLLKQRVFCLQPTLAGNVFLSLPLSGCRVAESLLLRYNQSNCVFKIFYIMRFHLCSNYLWSSLLSGVSCGHISNYSNLLRFFSFISINVIQMKVSATEEQQHVSPLSSSCFRGFWWTLVIQIKHPLLPEWPKRCNASPIANHDHRERTISRKMEGLGTN